MTAYLPIAFQCCCTFQQIHTLEEGVGPEFPADLQHGTLESPLSFQRFIIHEHIQLENAHILHDVVSTDTQPPIQEPVVGPVAELLHQRGRDELKAVGQCRELYGPVAVRRMKPAIVIYSDGTIVAWADFQAL